MKITATSNDAESKEESLGIEWLKIRLTKVFLNLFDDEAADIKLKTKVAEAISQGVKSSRNPSGLIVKKGRGRTTLPLSHLAKAKLIAGADRAAAGKVDL